MKLFNKILLFGLNVRYLLMMFHFYYVVSCVNLIKDNYTDEFTFVSVIYCFA